MAATAIRDCAFTLGLAVLGAACQRSASAQVPDDPLGPIGCFEIVDAVGLASTTAIQLCMGATSVAPGQCFVATLARRGDLTTQQILQLCQRATSLEPLACYEQLDADGTLTNTQMLDYCGMRCPLGPAPPQSSNPQCLGAALDRANLATQMAGELCRNSRSAGPVECFIRGENVTELTESQLIDLCAQVWSCQYINVPPEGS